jgi:rhamnosyl/mannosyltransferase
LPCAIATIADQFGDEHKAVKVASWHESLDISNPLFEKIYAPALHKFLQSTKRIFVNSPAMVKMSGILEEFSDKCAIVPPGIDTSILEKVDPQKVVDLRQQIKRRIVLYVGPLEPGTGCDVLIKSMKEMEADLVIAGDGSMRAEWHQLSGYVGVGHKVRFMGEVVGEDLAALYHACDVFVLPSESATETFGLNQVNAMVAGKPVINTSIPTGVPWVSQHGVTGLTVQPGNVAALERALKTLVLSGDDTRQKFGNAGRRRAYSNFTIERQVQNTMDIYDELLAGTTPGVRRRVTQPYARI